MYNFLFKYIIVGDSGVGKSCLMSRFVNDKFIISHDMTIGVEFGSRVIDIEGKKIKIQLWDTAGQESFKSITLSYYRGSTGIILCYDTTDSQSFKNIIKWLKEIESKCNHKPLI